MRMVYGIDKKKRQGISYPKSAMLYDLEKISLIKKDLSSFYFIGCDLAHFVAPFYFHNYILNF